MGERVVFHFIMYYIIVHDKMERSNSVENEKPFSVKEPKKLLGYPHIHGILFINPYKLPLPNYTVLTIQDYELFFFSLY